MRELVVEALHVEAIEVPARVVRGKSSRVDDGILERSIRTGGIQVPIVVLPWGNDRYLLVKGSRRLAIAKRLGLPKVPAVIDEVPEGEDTEGYARKIRFILDEHRQDLVPSQKAELVDKLKSQLGLTNAQVAAYLGVDSDSVTNWLAVKHYIPDVVTAMDAGLLTMQAARVFDGMSEHGQRFIFEHHSQDIMGSGKTGVHRRLRKQYPPTVHPEFYRDPKLVADRLKRVSGKRKKPQKYTHDEKKKLLNSVEMKEAELAELQDEAKRLREECIAAGPLVAAIIRNKELWKQVPEAMRPELERFSEVY